MRSHLLLLSACICLSASCAKAEDIKAGFTAPPAAARPWVYWFWLNGNITREGITADLEAMKRVGIGGVLIMEVDQGAPLGPVPFGGPKWRELFQHVCREAKRLGLEVNMSNDAGWCGSGGPWVTPAQSMQKLVWTETPIEGGAAVDVVLPQPPAVANFYEDIQVFAYRTPANAAYRLPDLVGRNGQDRRDYGLPAAALPPTPEGTAIPRGEVVDLTASFKNGRLAWNAPAGSWTVVRLGHTSTGKDNHPAPESGRGLESDKLSRAATDSFFAGLMGKLVADNGPEVGKSLVATHIDSWEVHSQNWTNGMWDEFKRLRGYDGRPYVAALTGRVVESMDATERFLYDYRQTISDLILANYGGRFRELANKNGLRLTIEAYGDGGFDNMGFAEQADEPMGEFWSWSPYGANESCTEMASAAHIYGKRILGAEALTADSGERWQGHPGLVKPIADWALCEGINRFVFHRYALQPWKDVKPGMSMGPWGLHYERTETWWEQSKAWHQYLSRCQYLLRQGLFVADVCFLQPEGAPRTFSVPAAAARVGLDRPGYNFDGCTPSALMTRVTVKDGRLALPDGMSYRVLALPDSETMTPALLRHIGALVEAGATVIGPKPVRSPSLAGYPASDDEVRTLADRIWGDCDGKTVTEHAYGKGRVIWGRTPAEVLAAQNVPKDFTCSLNGTIRFIHRAQQDGTDLYFLANEKTAAREAICTFRAAGKRPELWWPETGRTERPAWWTEENGVVKLPLRFESAQSVFVVFRPASGKTDPVVAATRNGEPLTGEQPRDAIVILSASYGPPNDPARTRDVKAKLQAMVDRGETEFQVTRLAEGDDPAFGVVKTLNVEFTVDGKPAHVSGRDPEQMGLASFTDAPATARFAEAANGAVTVEAWQPGRYELTTAAGRKLEATVQELPGAVPLAGPWTLRLPNLGGSTGTVTLDHLMSWSEHPDAAVRYYSGTGEYTLSFDAPASLLARDRGLYLDLGDVQVMAEVALNGHPLGILWKAPYRVDVTGLVRERGNRLTVKVTNLWINRMIGDEQLPEDSARNGDGTLKSWPDWLGKGLPSPTGRQTFTSWRLWGRDSALQPSGLIGPVTLQPTGRVTAR